MDYELSEEEDLKWDHKLSKPELKVSVKKGGSHMNAETLYLMT